MVAYKRAKKPHFKPRSGAERAAAAKRTVVLRSDLATHDGERGAASTPDGESAAATTDLQDAVPDDAAPEPALDTQISAGGDAVA